jgi:uncharacterized membrane protein
VLLLPLRCGRETGMLLQLQLLTVPENATVAHQQRCYCCCCCCHEQLLLLLVSCSKTAVCSALLPFVSLRGRSGSLQLLLLTALH